MGQGTLALGDLLGAGRGTQQPRPPSGTGGLSFSWSLTVVAWATAVWVWFSSTDEGHVLQLNRGVLIAIEGIDGAGKTTQVRMLTEQLSALGLDVVRTKEPTNGPFGRRIRLSAIEGRLSPNEEFEAFVQDRRDHVAELLAPALDANKVVIVDRYYVSSIAYQGARGLSPAAIREANEDFAPKPDAVFLLEVPPELGLSRVEVRDGQGNHFEQIDELERASRIFADLDDSSLNITRIDGRLSREMVNGLIMRELYAGSLFRAACSKHYLSACEPAFCVFLDSCAYPRLGQMSPVAEPALGE